MSNNWKRYFVVLRMLRPLHIGYLPFKGSVVSPTRYYVPGRNLWGAFTKQITETLHNSPKPLNYREVGRLLRDNMRFSYFFLYDEESSQVYAPRYTEQGLFYGGLSEHEFEGRFISSFVSTSIDPEFLRARYQGLHEIEFINPHFRDEKGRIRAVRLAGCIWVGPDADTDTSGVPFNIVEGDDAGVRAKGKVIKRLILGGESKYGFGDVELERIDSSDCPGALGDVLSQEPKATLKESTPLPAHLLLDKDFFEDKDNLSFKGRLELISGRGYFDPDDEKRPSDGKPGSVRWKARHALAPGSYLMKDNSFEVNWDGVLKKT